MDLVREIGLIFGAAGIIGVVVSFFNFPLIIAYLGAGLILGPIGLHLIPTGSIQIEGLTTLGIAFMLFLVGLELDIGRIKSFGLSAIIIALTQVTLTALLTSILAAILGFHGLTVWYIGLSVAFSSTIIGVKLLSDKNQLVSLHGRIIIAILLIQDFLALATLIVAQTLYSNTTNNLIFSVSILITKFVLFAIVAYIVRRSIIRHIFNVFAKNVELLFIASIGWALLLAYLANFLGFSIAIGAFVAGVTLAPLEVSEEIRGRVRWLRDFFLVIFLSLMSANLLDVISLHLFIIGLVFIGIVVLAKPLLAAILLGLNGYRRRTSFLVGTYLSQASEFSLILATIGAATKQINHEGASLIALITFGSMAISSIAISRSDSLFHRLTKWLSFLERKGYYRDDYRSLDRKLTNHVILFGANRVGKPILKQLQKLGHELVVVDFDPLVIKNLRAKQVPALYGDMGDPELVEHLGLLRAKMVISTAHDFDDTAAILKKVKVSNSQAICFVTASNAKEALQLYADGADYVVLPYHLSGEHLADLIADMRGPLAKSSPKMFTQRKKIHIEELKSIVEDEVV